MTPDTEPQPRPLIFISYSHLDKVWKDRLLSHLKVLEGQARLEAWADSKIDVGDDWETQIQEAMAQASIAVLLITRHFLNSSYIKTKELPVLLERRRQGKLRVIPVIAVSCAWDSVPWLKGIQVYPGGEKCLADFSKPRWEKELTAVTKKIGDFLNLTAPLPGADDHIPYPQIYISKLPSTSPLLFGRDEVLEQLDRAWDNPHCHILELVAFGGVGKTSLVNKWLLGIAEQDYRGATRVYAESFFSQGAKEGRQASADAFIQTALKDFGDADPTLGFPWEKGRRLADMMRLERTLLILDGLEPLQYPTGEMKGHLKDPALQTLLKELAVANPGLVVVTTRLEVAELQGYTESRDPAKDPPVAVIDLENLTEEAGADLLEHLGVQGRRQELIEAALDFRGHALALTLLGRYLAVVHDGDIRRRDEIPALTEEEEKGGHARRVMQAYEIWLKDRPELLEILRLMGLFDRPAEAGVIKAVRKNPAIEGLSSHLATLPKNKWKYAIKDLRDLRLIDKGDTHSHGTLDCHPLVREYFGERLQRDYPESWQEGHSRLYEYYKNLVPEFPETLAAIAPLYAAVGHGCRAGRHQEALDKVYWPRICRKGDAFSMRNLGAISADLVSLAAFFEQTWHSPAISLSSAAKSFLLNEAGFRLWVLGRIEEAIEPLKASLNRNVDREDWLNASGSAINLAEFLLTLGDLEQSEALGRQCIDLSSLSNTKEEIVNSISFMAYLRLQKGADKEAEELFNKAEIRVREQDPKELYLYSANSFYICNLLMDQGRYQEVLTRASHTLAFAQSMGWLQDIGLDHLSLGRAYLAQWVEEAEGDLNQAAKHFAEAVDFLRQSGQQRFIVLGLMGRAEFFRATQDWPAAHRDLEEAMEMCQRSGMRLYDADAHLEYARLHLAQGKKEEAHQSLAVAKEMIQQMGYHRRDREVKELEGQL